MNDRATPYSSLQYDNDEGFKIQTSIPTDPHQNVPLSLLGGLNIELLALFGYLVCFS